ncbi:MAG: type II secretion system protein [Lachnospiraceae bacterium]|nr:type II secretion system protein [Lachnospiraceae bacterium]
MKKMNNKGFSLVELIVVVLIMAIIAVALAPQVMKWVENSRKSTDASNYDSIYSAANIALGNETVLKWVRNMGGNATISATATNSGYTDGLSSVTGWADQMAETLGSGWATTLKVKAAILDCKSPSSGTGTCGYFITVKEDGTVERSWAPYNPATEN